ncbi:MAG: hypothetical protein GC193_05075 [Cryomorphaceae bacterium]|nr:hypothetical protein [Cryomorphaceae bacterium]
MKYFFSHILLIHLILLPGLLSGQLMFVENQGQFSNDVFFQATTSTGIIQLKSDAIRFVKNHEQLVHSELEEERPDTLAWCWDMRFENVEQIIPSAEVSSKTPTKHHYYFGRDESQWRSNVPSFFRVVYSDLYSGIDLVVYSNEHGFKYDFIVKPGANPGQVKWSYNGLLGAELQDNDLHLKTGFGTIIDSAPVAYQGQRGVDVQFEKVKGGYGFDLGT